MNPSLTEARNGNYELNSTQGRNQMSPTGEHEGVSGPSKRFLLGNNSKPNWRSSQENPEYTTYGYSRKNDLHLDEDLLKHLSNDFAGLLHRRDISDCCLKVQGNSSFDRTLLLHR